MKIVLITSKLRFEDNGSPIGGSVVDLHLKAKGLAELGHEVSVVTAFSEANKLFAPLPYAVFERRIPGRGLVGLQRGVYALLKEFSAKGAFPPIGRRGSASGGENKADVFYIDGHMFLYGGGAYRLFGGRVPVVGFFNIRLNSWADTASDVIQPSLYRRAKKKIRYALERVFGAPIANRIDAYIFNTPQVQKLYHNFGIARRKQNSIIEDFIETRELERRFAITNEWVRMHQENAERLTLLATGRMLPEKGFELVIRALAIVENKKRCRLILSGGGPDKERLENLVRELGLTDVVSFPGWVDKEKLYEFFKKAHVFVFPKWWIEYGSAVLTEAMAFGLPSVIPGGGALEWLTDGCALTFTNDNVLELARRIEELGESWKRRTELAEKSLARAEALDANVLAKRLEELLVSLISCFRHPIA